MPDPVLRIVDAQAGGDVSRVIVGGAPPLDGASVAEKCADFARRFDHLRLKLIQPPHGAMHMCPVLLLPPERPDSDFGVIIMESMGYPPISGSNLFCAAAVALEQGFAGMREPDTRLRVDTPAGVVTMTARCSGGHCRRVEFENTPSCIKSSLLVQPASTTARVQMTLVAAGVDYAVVSARELGIPLAPASYDDLRRSGSRLARESATDFVLFYDDIERTGPEIHCTIAVFQNPGVICFSPTGTGTSAMLTLMHSRGEIDAAETLIAESPAGNVFQGRILAAARTGEPLRTAISGDVTLLAQVIIA
jgi:proline racemase